MFHAAKRRTALDTQYEGLVFGRLDIDHAMLRAAAVDANSNGHHRPSDGSSGGDRETRTSAGSESSTRTTRLWSSTGGRPPRPFYRSTPTDPPAVCGDVITAPPRVVLGVEDDLLLPEAP